MIFSLVLNDGDLQRLTDLWGGEADTGSV